MLTFLKPARSTADTCVFLPSRPTTSLTFINSDFKLTCLQRNRIRRRVRKFPHFSADSFLIIVQHPTDTFFGGQFFGHFFPLRMPRTVRDCCTDNSHKLSANCSISKCSTDYELSAKTKNFGEKFGSDISVHETIQIVFPGSGQSVVELLEQSAGNLRFLSLISKTIRGNQRTVWDISQALTFDFPEIFCFSGQFSKCLADSFGVPPFFITRTFGQNFQN